MPTLYRQYRPQTFGDVIGQRHVTSILEQAVMQTRISHAYLFQGPRGTGKTSTARIFAKRINCKNPKGAEPCGECPLCVATTKGANIDIIEIDAASNRGIDDVRALRETVALAPAMGSYKVYIIDEVHMLSRDAFSALLKTLEEPSAHAVFILATTELHKVPATIASRCQVFRFKRASEDEMKTRLSTILKAEGRTVDDKVISFIVSRSDGCYRDAESLLGQILTQKESHVSLSDVVTSLGLPSPDTIQQFLAALTEQDANKALDVATAAYQEGHDVEQFIAESIRTARDTMIRNITESGTSSQQLPHIIRALIQATQDLAYMPEPLIALQLAILTVCKKAQAKPVVTKITAASVEDIWEQVIQKVRESNPVSATFLRAVEPSQVKGSTVVLRAHYPLHKSFFDRPENKKTIEQIVSSLLGSAITIQCQLDDQLQQNSQQESVLMKNVEEVFGVKAT